MPSEAHPDTEYDARVVRMLGGVLRTMLVIMPLVLLASLGISKPGEIAVIAVLLLVVAVLFLLYRKGRVATVFYGLVAALVAFGIGLGLIFGSMRSTGMLAFVGAVVVGGIFLDRAALVGTVAASATGAAILILAQNLGWLPTPNYAVGLQHWFIFVIALGAIALNIYFARQLMNQDARRAAAGEARFLGIFRSNPAAVVLLKHADRSLVEANEAAERMFRVPAAMVQGEPTDSRFWVDAGERNAAWALVNAQGRAVGLSVRLRRADGEEFSALLSVELTEESGERLIIASILDVSAEERARAAQRASEDRFAKAMHSSPIGMTVARVRDGRFVEVNPAGERTLGYSREELLANTSLSLGAWPSSEHRERFLARLRAEGRVFGQEMQLRDKHGAITDAVIYASLVDFEGEECVYASTIDVTAQKREAALIDDIARGVSAATGDAFFRLLAENLARVTGADWVMVGEIVQAGEKVRTVVRMVDGIASDAAVYNVANSPCEAVLESGAVRSWPDRVAELFPLDKALAKAGMRSYAGAPLLDADAKPVGVVNIVSRRPLEDAARLESVLRIFAARAQAELIRIQRDREIHALNASLDLRVVERTRQLEAANDELESFSYSVSHDMRAPLRQIEGFLRIFAEDNRERLSEDDRAILDRVFGGTRRMNDLIEGLLGLAQIGRQPVHESDVDVSAMASQVVAELRAAEPARHVEVDIQSGVATRGDARLVRVVLDNLLGNAWKFTGKRAEARITVGCEALAGGRPVVYVRDNGAGFDPEFSDKLFKPFNRLHAASEFGGTGVGLATVHRIVVRHGGRIWAESAPGAGATFRFFLGRPQSAATEPGERPVEALEQ